jgi:hypothetical protein
MQFRRNTIERFAHAVLGAPPVPGLIVALARIAAFRAQQLAHRHIVRIVSQGVVYEVGGRLG